MGTVLEEGLYTDVLGPGGAGVGSEASLVGFGAVYDERGPSDEEAMTAGSSNGRSAFGEGGGGVMIVSPEGS